MKRAINRGRLAGFTLVELMIVVGIVAILAAIAIPAYNDQVRRSRRAAAQGILTEVAQCMERFNTSNGTYVGGDAGCQPAVSPFYNYVINVASRNTYTVTAAPDSASGQTNDACGTLGLNQAGQKTHTSGTDCWR